MVFFVFCAMKTFPAGGAHTHLADVWPHQHAGLCLHFFKFNMRCSKLLFRCFGTFYIQTTRWDSGYLFISCSEHIHLFIWLIGGVKLRAPEVCNRRKKTCKVVCSIVLQEVHPSKCWREQRGAVRVQSCLFFFGNFKYLVQSNRKSPNASTF